AGGEADVFRQREELAPSRPMIPGDGVGDDGGGAVGGAVVYDEGAGAAGYFIELVREGAEAVDGKARGAVVEDEDEQTHDRWRPTGGRDSRRRGGRPARGATGHCSQASRLNGVLQRRVVVCECNHCG